MTENPQQVGQWLDFVFSYGTFWVYATLFVACFIENIFPPFPGDSFIAAAGGLVAIDKMNFGLSFLLVLAGGLSSVMVMYLLGRKYGRDFFIRKNYKYFSSADIVRFETNLKKWGALLMISSRFVVGFRSVIAVGAGIGRYHPVKMFVYSALSYVLFAGLIFYITLVVVENIDEIAYYFTMYKYIAWPIVVLVVAMIIVWKITSVRKNKS